MNFLKMLKKMLAKGFATEEEKVSLRKELKTQDADTQELASEDVEKVEALPETDPKEEDVEQEVEKAIKKIFAGEKKEISNSIKNDIVSDVQKILDQHKQKMEKGVGVYSPEAKKDVKRKAVNKFLREGIISILSNNDTKEFEAARKEMTTDGEASPYTGYITDEVLSAEIRHLMTVYGVAAREFTTVSFTQSAYKANNLATDVSVFWVDEAGSIRSTQAVLGQESLQLKKLAVIITLTRELLQEQEIDFVSFLGERVAEGFAQAEDEAFFIGDGTSAYGSFTGLVKNANVNNIDMASGSTSFEDVSVSDLRSMQDGTPQGALAGAKYYMHRSILSVIRNLRSDSVVAGDGKGVFLYTAPSGNDPANIDGYPISLVESMPAIGDDAAEKSFVLFGDLKKATIRGIRGGINVDRFNAGTVKNVANNADINLITTDREAVRWINQVGYIAIVPKAVTKLTTAAV